MNEITMKKNLLKAAEKKSATGIEATSAIWGDQ